MGMLTASIRKIVLVCLGIVPLLIPAAALCEDEYTTPTRKSQVPWMAILYTAVGLIGIAVVAFKHARRTHLD